MFVAGAVKWLFRSGTLWVMVISSILYGAYTVAKPAKPELTAEQTEMIAKLDGQVSAWLSELAVPRATTVFLTLGRDEFGFVSDPLRQVVWQSDRFDLVDASWRDKLCKLADWSRPTVGSVKDAVAAARARDCRYALWGRVDDLSDVRGEARLAVRLELVEAADQQRVADQRFEVESGDSSPPLFVGASGRERGSHVSVVTLLFLWLIATLLLPLLTYPLGQRIFTMESNAATLALLIGYVLASASLAYVMLLGQAGTAVRGIVLLIVFGLALFYNWHAMVVLKRLSE